MVAWSADSARSDRAAAPLAASRRRGGRLFGGGASGNEQLTAATGVVLLVLLAALGVTIVRIGGLLNEHMFLGMLLLGPVALKLSSTGYRFARYYTSNPRYRAKGPPPAIMRAIAPVVVISTVVVFASGVALLFVGPGSRGTLLPLHKVSFIVWIAFTALHVLGHLAELPAALRASGGSGRPWDDLGAGRGGRALSLAGALVGGLVLALAFESRFGVWDHVHRHLH
jgi:hypothetical protein